MGTRASQTALPLLEMNIVLPQILQRCYKRPLDVSLHMCRGLLSRLFVASSFKYSLFIIHTFIKRFIDARPFLFVAMPVPHTMCGALSAFDAKFWLIWSP